MATMNRRYNPDVPIDITSDEVNGEVSAEAKDENKNVKVKVVKWSNSESEREEGVFFMIEIGIPFRWLMIEYCQILGLDYQTTRFELNGAKLRETDTPHQLGMHHDDVIFAFPNREVQRMKKTEYPIAKANEENKKIFVTVKWINNNIDDIKDDDNDELDDKKEIINLRIENDVPLRWLMILYCDKFGLNFDTTRFEFNGARLRGFDTPLHIRMLSFDVIYAYSSPCSNGLVHSNSRVHNNGDGRSSGLYQATICIRMHKQKDTFVRVIRATPLLPQLTLGLSNAGIVVVSGSMCFVREGTRLTREHTAKELDIVNGDVIDAFIFDKHSCSLSIIEASKHSQESELYLEVSVASKYHETIYFRLKRNTRLKKLMDAYCHRFGMLKGALFFYHGRALDGSKSPDEEKLVDKAIIYAFPFMLT